MGNVALTIVVAQTGMCNGLRFSVFIFMSTSPRVPARAGTRGTVSEVQTFRGRPPPEKRTSWYKMPNFLVRHSSIPGYYYFLSSMTPTHRGLVKIREDWSGC